MINIMTRPHAQRRGTRGAKTAALGTLVNSRKQPGVEATNARAGAGTGTGGIYIPGVFVHLYLYNTYEDERDRARETHGLRV